MTPEQSKMILRKLEKLEEAYVNQAKRLKMLEKLEEAYVNQAKRLKMLEIERVKVIEADLSVLQMRLHGLSKELEMRAESDEATESLANRVTKAELMIDQVIRLVGRRG